MNKERKDFSNVHCSGCSSVTCAAAGHATPHGALDGIMMNRPVGVGCTFLAVLFQQLSDLCLGSDEHHLLARVFIGDLEEDLCVIVERHQILIVQEKTQVVLHAQFLHLGNEFLEEWSQILSLSQLKHT